MVHADYPLFLVHHDEDDALVNYLEAVRKDLETLRSYNSDEFRTWRNANREPCLIAAREMRKLRLKGEHEDR